MKKKILAATLSAILLCQPVPAEVPDAADTNTVSMETVPEEVELNLLALDYGNGNAAWWLYFAEDFHLAHPYYTLNVETLSPDKMDAELQKRMEEGTLPDLAQTSSFLPYAEENKLISARKALSEETLANIYPSYLEQTRNAGFVWAVPDGASPQILYYNADLFANASLTVPTTPEEMMDVCDALVKFYDYGIYPLGMTLCEDSAVETFASYIWNHGGDFTDENGNWALNTKENLSALTYAARLYQNGYTNSDPIHESYEDLMEMFGAGKIAMLIAPESMPAYLNSRGYYVNYASAAVPSSTGTSVSKGDMNYFICFNNHYSDAQLEAIAALFDSFYADNSYTSWTRSEKLYPVTNSGGEALTAGDSSKTVWVNSAANARFYPDSMENWEDAKLLIGDAMRNTLQSEDLSLLLDELQLAVSPAETEGDDTY